MGLAEKGLIRMIIGITGKAGSGKDTVADILVKDHGFVRIGFADVMKRFCAEVFGFTDEQLFGPSSERNRPDHRFPRSKDDVDRYERWLARANSTEGNLSWRQDCRGVAEGLEDRCFLSPRRALQQLGTDWGRNCYPDVWIDYALRVAETLLREGCEYYPSRGLTVEKADKPPRGVVFSDVRFLNEAKAIKAKGGILWRTVYDGGEKMPGWATAHASEQEMAKISADWQVYSPTLEELPNAVAAILGVIEREAGK
jgi:hypothetical protein